MTGLRNDQSVTRTDTPEIEIDAAHGGIAKLNPIVALDDGRGPRLRRRAQASRSTRCTTAATRRSAARPARAPSSRASTRAPAAGGGRIPRTRSAGSTCPRWRNPRAAARGAARIRARLRGQEPRAQARRRRSRRRGRRQRRRSCSSRGRRRERRQHLRRRRRLPRGMGVLRALPVPGDVGAQALLRARQHLPRLSVRPRPCRRGLRLNAAIEARTATLSRSAGRGRTASGLRSVIFEATAEGRG